MSHVFLDTDGTLELGLLVVVRAATGVMYEHQCGGTATEIRGSRASRSRLAPAMTAAPLVTWFHSEHAVGDTPAR